MKSRLTLALTLTLAATLACSFPLFASTPTPSLPPPTATFLFPTALPTTIPTLTPTPPFPTLTPTNTQVYCPPVTSTSGSKAVILVQPNDVLNIRSAPGANNLIVGTYAFNQTMIATTGATASVDGSTWVQVCDGTSMVGWVNGKYLTEYVPPSQFCADLRVPALLDQLNQAFSTTNGDRLAALVSPLHGVDVWMWNTGNAINFDVAHARAVFQSDYVNDWGAQPASGQDTTGSFRDVVLPELQDVFTALSDRRCNDPNFSSYANTWPAVYTNLNFYQLYRHGTPGTELDWNAWLVGVEYVNGQPYLFSLIHFIWTP